MAVLSPINLRVTNVLIMIKIILHLDRMISNHLKIFDEQIFQMVIV